MSVKLLDNPVDIPPIGRKNIEYLKTNANKSMDLLDFGFNQDDVVCTDIPISDIKNYIHIHLRIHFFKDKIYYVVRVDTL